MLKYIIVINLKEGTFLSILGGLDIDYCTFLLSVHLWCFTVQLISNAVVLISIDIFVELLASALLWIFICDGKINRADTFLDNPLIVSHALFAALLSHVERKFRFECRVCFLVRFDLTMIRVQSIVEVVTGATWA